MQVTCCRCGAALAGGGRADTADLHCVACGEVYRFNRYGYAELLPPDLAVESSALDTTTADYADDQHCTGVRVVRDYLLPRLQGEPFHTVLDVGCGTGAGIRQFAASGYDAYGVDLPALSRFWAEAGNDPNRFFACNAVRLPFANDCFDVVYSLGVVEHVGTVIGHCTLRPDFALQRERYAAELVRVTKPGGRIIVACPNKSFPVDIQHGPTDQAGPAHSIRSMIFDRSGINLHKTWGVYHLLSYREVRQLFCGQAGARSLEALPLAEYFAFGRFQQGFLKPFGRFAEYYVRRLPSVLRATFLNPYVLVEIRA